MEKRDEIHVDISKDEAYRLMELGHKICHRYYTDDEYIYMLDGIIYDEQGYKLGTKYDEFWSERQKWTSGWMTINAR